MTTTNLEADLMKMPTRSRDEIARMSFTNSRRLPQVIVIDGHRKRWVGIGWVDEGAPDGSEEALVLDEVKCPTCAASKTEPCARPDGSYAAKNHAARLRLSVRRAIEAALKATATGA